MGIAESMRSIVDGIVVSHDSRAKAIGVLVGDVDKMLKGFTSDRKKMSTEQARNLADFVKDLSKSTGNMLNIFHANRKQMSAEQAKGLADFANSLARDVGSMLSGFEKDRSKMSKELKDKLAKEAKEISIYVKNKLKEFSQDHADMSDALKRSLAKYVGDIVNGVSKLLGEYGSDMAKAKDAWESMSSTLAKAKKSGVAPKIEVREKVTTVKEAVKEKPKAKPKTVEGQILALLEEHPRGRTMVQMGEEMGIHFASLLHPMKKLLESGKVNKVDKKYRLA